MKASATASLHPLQNEFRSATGLSVCFPPGIQCKSELLLNNCHRSLRHKALLHVPPSISAGWHSSRHQRAPVGCKQGERCCHRSARVPAPPWDRQRHAGSENENTSLETPPPPHSGVQSSPPANGIRVSEAPTLRGGQHLFQPAGADLTAPTRVGFGLAVTYNGIRKNGISCDQQMESVRARRRCPDELNQGPLSPRKTPRRGRGKKRVDILLEGGKWMLPPTSTYRTTS